LVSIDASSLVVYLCSGFNHKSEASGSESHACWAVGDRIDTGTVLGRVALRDVELAAGVAEIS
jgi:hypothetical protein